MLPNFSVIVNFLVIVTIENGTGTFWLSVYFISHTDNVYFKDEMYDKIYEIKIVNLYDCCIISLVSIAII